jgi:hypothetical protein
MRVSCHYHCWFLLKLSNSPALSAEDVIRKPLVYFFHEWIVNAPHISCLFSPLLKQYNRLFSLQQFVYVIFALNNILANTHFSVNSVIQFNIESVMKGNSDYINLRLLYDVIQ